MTSPAAQAPEASSRAERRWQYRLAYWLAVWFGCGLVPLAPGTAGTIGAIPLFLAVAPLGSFAVLATGMLLTIVGIWAAGVVARIKRATDPQIVVIDEVAGVMLTLSCAPRGWKGLAVGFVLFRLFDQTKPWPARRFESLPGGYGIVLDDVVAAIWAGALMVAAQWSGWL